VNLDGATALVTAIEGDTVEHYLPDMKAIVEMKTGDLDGFLAGMVAMADAKAAEDSG
jgi:hypothetical protein